MFNLYNCLTPLDLKRIENFINEYGTESDYIGNETYLKYWSTEKIKLYKLLGCQLIKKVPFTYIKPKAQIDEELSTLCSKTKLFRTFINEWDAKYKEFTVPSPIFYRIWDIFSLNTLTQDSIPETIKYKFKDKPILQLQRGMKPVRAMAKIIKYFDFSNEVANLFEEFRIAHSMIYNEKEIHGNICFSIHPLDFMTMSDNSNNWVSCMSWSDQGCYRIGTVEMMNSNNVICCYIESKNLYRFSKEHQEEEEYIWNNKKWRQLVYVTKDIIVGGKSYPYANADVTKQILNILRESAQENLGWTYSFGPELYKDMTHVGTLYRMERNRDWLRNKTSFKHNILFDTKGMYNDMLNANHYDYWCIRNKVKKMKIISYSGKAPCLCCMSEVPVRNDDVYDCYMHDEGAYNERYYNRKRLICEDCREDRWCYYCDNEGGYHKTFKIGDKHICSKCYETYIRTCPDCGKPFHINFSPRHNLLVRHTNNKIYLQDVNEVGKIFRDLSQTDLLSAVCTCPECKEKIMNKFSNEIIHYDPARTYMSWDSKDEVLLSKEIYDKDDDFVIKHQFNNLEIPKPN